MLAVPIRIELIVVDDGSTDGTRDLLTALDAEVPVQADLPAEERRQGRGASPRLPGSQRRSRRHPGRRPRVLARGVPGPHRAHLPGPRRRRVRVAVPRAPPRVHVHALRGQPAADAHHEHPVQHDADGHGDLLQGHAHRGAAVVHARLERLRHRARADREDLQARTTASTKCRSPTTGAGYEEGKKITWRDGVVALWVLIKYRFTRVNEFLRLLRYAAPYRGQLTVALLAMVVYAAGAALARVSHPTHSRQSRCRNSSRCDRSRFSCSSRTC